MNRKQRRAAAAKKGVILDPTGKAIIPPRVEQAPPEVISIGYVYESGPKAVAGMWHQSVLKLLQAGPQIRGGIAFRELPTESGPFLSRARNDIVRRFLGFGDPYLLFTDTDIVFEPQDLDLLLGTDAAIAGAHYMTAAPGVAPWATALVEDSGDAAPDDPDGKSGEGKLVPVVLPELPDPPEEDPDDIDSYPERIGAYFAALNDPQYDPVPVAAVGCGFTLYSRDVVETVAEAYDHPFEYDGDRGEDIVFCERARNLGFDVVVVPRARVGHLKSGVI